MKKSNLRTVIKTILQELEDESKISEVNTTSNIDGYAAHHWHYTISNDGGDIGTSTDEMVNAGGGGFGPATINDVNVLNNPDNYTITAWIVKNDGHARVSGLPDITQAFTIQPNIATMGVSTSAIDEDIDEIELKKRIRSFNFTNHPIKLKFQGKIFVLKEDE